MSEELGFTMEDMAQVYDAAQGDNKAVEQPIAPENEISDQGKGQEEENQEGVKTPEPDALSPLDKWSDEVKEAFKSLPRNLQEHLLQRERDVETHLTKKSQEIAERSREFEGLGRIAETRRQVAAMNGMTVEQELSQLYQLSDYASKDPLGFVQYFAQQRGLDLSGLSQQGGQGDDADPVSALKQQVSKLEQTIQQQQQTTQQQQLNQFNGIVEAFRSSEGNTHFDTVQNEILAIIPMIQRDNPSMAPQDVLKEAYDRACYANPTVRQQIIDAQKTAEEAKRIERDKEAARRARDAQGKFVKSGDESGKTHFEDESFEETMSRAFDKMNRA